MCNLKIDLVCTKRLSGLIFNSVMMNFKSKIALVLVLFVLLLLFSTSSVSADGALVNRIHDVDMFYWELQDMDQQFCAVNYEDGFENMLLAVDVGDLQGDKAVWIFPVPANPNDTTIDVIKGFPILYGYDVKRRADDIIYGAFALSASSQVWTAPFFGLFVFGMGAGGVDRGVGEGITVHEHIEKMGLITELITAEEESAFYSYLTDKGLELPSNLKSILHEYIGQEYSFVVSWIPDVEKFNQSNIGVFITFPTDKIYFPLKPTSVYESQEIPIIVYVMGHVTPELYPEITTGGTEVNYFVENYYNVPDNLSSFFNGKTSIRDLKYTKIKINAQSKSLKEDLWIQNSTPSGVALADFMSGNGWVCGIIVWITFLALNSCLASLLSGMLVFRKDKPSMKKFALLGISNFLTLAGFAIASFLLKIDTRFTKAEETIQKKSEFREVIKKVLLVTSLITALLVVATCWHMIMWNIEYGDIYAALIEPVIIYAILFPLIMPFVWAYYGNRKTPSFIILFTFSFLALSLITYLAFQVVFSYFLSL